MPRRLEIWEIQHLALIPNVQRQEVKRYLIGMTLTLSAEAQLKRMEQVAKANSWTDRTKEAVSDGIWKSYREDLNKENEKRGNK